MYELSNLDYQELLGCCEYTLVCSRQSLESKKSLINWAKKATRRRFACPGGTKEATLSSRLEVFFSPDDEALAIPQPDALLPEMVTTSTLCSCSGNS